jgi:hypothetical protein
MAGHPLFPELGGADGYDVTPQLDYPAGVPWVDEVQVSVELPMGPMGPEGPEPTFAIHEVAVATAETPVDVALHQGENPLNPPGDGVWYFDFVVPRGAKGADGVDGLPGPPLRVQGELPPGGLTASSPPPNGSDAVPGDSWLVGYDLWIWTTDGWVVAEDYRGPTGPAGHAYVGVPAPPEPHIQGDLWFNPDAMGYSPTGLRVDRVLRMGEDGGELWGNTNGELILGVGHTSTEQARLTTAGLKVSTALYVGATKALSLTGGELRLGSAGTTTTAEGTLLATTPTAASDPLAVATKAYVDGKVGSVGGFVEKKGDTMTGPLVLPGAPTSDLQAATKKYVDDRSGIGDTALKNWADDRFINVAGDTMTGYLEVPYPHVDADAAQVGWVNKRIKDSVGDVNATRINGFNVNFGNSVITCDANGRGTIETWVANYDGCIVSNGHAEAYNGPVHVWLPNVGNNRSSMIIETERLAGAHVRVIWAAFKWVG